MLKLIIVLILLIFPSAGMAESVAEQFSWQDCATVASSNNYSLKAYRDAIEAARQRIAMSRNNFYPSLDASYSLSRSGSYGQASSNSNAGLDAQENLFNIGYSADLKLQKLAFEKTRAEYSSASADTRKNLFDAFTNVQYAQQLIKTLESIYELRKKNAKMVELQYEGGRESKGNKMRADALAFQAQTDIRKAQRDLVAYIRSLNSEMGLEDFKLIRASGTLSVPAKDINGDVEGMALRAPAVVVSRVSASAAKEQISSAAADIFPTLSATQSLGWSDERAIPAYRNWSLGLRLSLPIFSSGITYHKANKQRAENLYSKAQNEYKKTLYSARSDIEAAKAELESEFDSLLSTEMLLEAATQRHKEATIQYMSGLMNFQNWEQIEQEFVNSEKNYLGVLRAINLAKSQWDKLSGIGLGE